MKRHTLGHLLGNAAPSAFSGTRGGGRAVRVVISIFLMSVTAVGFGTTPAAGAETWGDWKSVSVGADHTCAIRAQGYLYCWGSNTYGQLGDGTLTTRTSPKWVSGYSDWKLVRAGSGHTCGIRGSALLYCWGLNNYGQLGDGTTTARRSPKLITTYRYWRTVSPGWLSTCAIRGSGIYYCWGWRFDGDPDEGQEGTSRQLTPRQISTVTDWKLTSMGGKHHCAIRASSGLLYCGYNLVPELFTSTTGWTAVSDGDPYTCAIRSPGTLSCDDSGWHRVGTASDWRTLATALGINHDGHVCAIRGSGLLYCWGVNSNGSGQIGDGTRATRSNPVRITSATDWRSVAVADAASCAIRGSGALYCWGRRPGTYTDWLTPRRI